MRGMWLRKSVWKAWLPRGLHPADFLVEAPSRRRRRHGRPRPALRTAARRHVGGERAAPGEQEVRTRREPGPPSALPANGDAFPGILKTSEKLPPHS